jgi:hypothetical protein
LEKCLNKRRLTDPWLTGDEDELRLTSQRFL